jgi:hypothetical protein
MQPLNQLLQIALEMRITSEKPNYTLEQALEEPATT